jgi:hypothetical protein
MGEALQKVGDQEPARTEALTPYEPRSLNEAMQLATYFAKSGLTSLGSPEAVFLVMATGAELGIPPTAALRAIHNIKGKPSPSAQLLVALCLKRTDICDYFRCTESTAERATYVTKRVGQPERSCTFTIQQAKDAGLNVDNRDGNWFKWRPQMLQARASSFLAREVYPDITLALYSREEMEDVEDAASAASTPTKPVLDAEFTETKPAAASAAKAPSPGAAASREADEQKADRLVAICMAEATTPAQLTEKLAKLKTVQQEGGAMAKGPHRDRVLAAYTTANDQIKAAISALKERAAANGNGAAPPTDDNTGPCGFHDGDGVVCNREGKHFGPRGYRCAKHESDEPRVEREPGADG